MKRIVILLILVMLLFTGCSVEKLDTTDLAKNMKTILTEKAKIHNIHYSGYEYYLPKGLKLLDREEYNAVLSDKMNNKYYLYVDVISYFHKKEVEYEIENDIHYSKNLNYNNKKGYIRIEKVEDKYFIEFVFNYGKMEAYVSENDLIDVVNNMCYVLRSIEFNDKILESLIGENILSYKEEDYNLFDKEAPNEKILDIIDGNIEIKSKDIFEDKDSYDYDLEDDSIFGNQ